MGGPAPTIYSPPRSSESKCVLSIWNIRQSNERVAQSPLHYLPRLRILYTSPAIIFHNSGYSILPLPFSAAQIESCISSLHNILLNELFSDLSPSASVPPPYSILTNMGSPTQPVHPDTLTSHTQLISQKVLSAQRSKTPKAHRIIGRGKHLTSHSDSDSDYEETQRPAKPQIGNTSLDLAPRLSPDRPNPLVLQHSPIQPRRSSARDAIRQRRQPHGACLKVFPQ